MLWVTLFEVVAPLSRGELTASAAIVNVIPDDLAKCAGA